MQNRIYDCIILPFSERLKKGEINRAAIAQRLHKDPAQITRWLAGPSNLTADTVSDLLLAIGADLSLASFLVENAPRPNYEHPRSKRSEVKSKPFDLDAMRSLETATASAGSAKITGLFYQESENHRG